MAIRQIHTEHVRAHTLSDRQVKCLHTGIGMSHGWIAKTGDWITYVEKHNGYRCGRMLGRVTAPDASTQEFDIPAIDGHLSVLQLSDDCCHAYIRWINPEDVRGIRKSPPAAFLAFMTGALPTADIVHKLSEYGTLSQSYVHLVPHHINAWAHGVSPAAWDAGVRPDADTESAK